MALGKASGPLSQILVAVAIALIVGGTAPWWWNELKTWLRPAAEGRKAETSTAPQASDAEKAARELLAAWNRKDRQAALGFADARAVDKLFGAPSLLVNSKEVTCYPVGTAQRDCQFSHAAGVLVFRLLETDQGWRVQNIEY
jgi:hypothetical protein